MEKTVNATLHNLVDFATDKLFSNKTVEHAKEKFYDTKDRFFDAKDKYMSKYSKKSENNNVLLYTGLAIAAGAAAYLIYKNREVIKDQIMSAVDKLKDVQEQYMSQAGEDNSHA